jgi:hypothetical protein
LLAAIALLLRLYSYLFHLLLSLFLIGISGVAIVNGKALELRMLPWSGFATNHWVLGLGIAGLASLFLATTRSMRWVFPLWALGVFIAMARGFFVTPYSFEGAEAFRSASWLTLGALVAFLGSLFLFRRRRRSRRDL